MRVCTLEHQPVAVVTRFWGKSDGDLRRLHTFITAATKVSDTVLVAVRVEEDRVNTLDYVNGLGLPGVEAFAVTPWLRFTPALNALMYKSYTLGYRQVLIASVEFPPLAEQVLFLQHPASTSGILAAGAVLPGHDFRPGEDVVKATGRTVPWHTFDVINIDPVMRAGIPMAADAPFNANLAGVEEVVMLAYYEKEWNLRSVLIPVPGIRGWVNTEGWSEQRLEEHRAKLRSKSQRPASQLRFMNLEPSYVHHMFPEEWAGCHTASKLAVGF